MISGASKVSEMLGGAERRNVPDTSDRRFETILRTASLADTLERGRSTIALEQPHDCADARAEIQVFDGALPFAPRVIVGVQHRRAIDGCCVVGAKHFAINREAGDAILFSHTPVVDDAAIANSALDHVARPSERAPHSKSAASRTAF